MNSYGSVNLAQIKMANGYDIIGVNVVLPSLMRFLPTKRITGPAQVNRAQFSISKDRWDRYSFRDRRICFKVAIRRSFVKIGHAKPPRNRKSLIEQIIIHHEYLLPENTGRKNIS